MQMERVSAQRPLARPLLHGPQTLLGGAGLREGRSL